MTLNDPFAPRARLAWLVQVMAFLAFITICLSVPLGLSYYVQNSTKPLLTLLSANRGTVAIVQPSGDSTAVREVDPERELTPNSRIVTNTTDTAFLQISDPDSQRLLVRGQIYGNSNLVLSTAESPRFGLSNHDQEIELELDHGRVRLTLLPIPEGQERAYRLTINTPHGRVNLHERGQYSVEVGPTETQIAVQSGMGAVSNPYGSLNLQPNERGKIVANEAPEGPLDNERNLVQNGEFRLEFEHWLPRDWNIERADQSLGKIEIAEIQGVPTLRFERVGVGHADAAVRQLINQDVTDYQSLYLVLDLRINEQTLGVCGTVGSECPLTLRLEYDDAEGVRRVWQQGLYAVGEISPTTPDTCINCQPPNIEHVNVPYSRLFTHEVNLLESLAFYSAPPPHYLHSLSIIGAGHTFEAEVVNISLLARE